ncbi:MULTISPECIES: MerR family transcriptional regulator [Rhodomicrobium]|uniref:MerR family transcriptional regulator n=1 Tax=Rhodomicrobium TaxID=1068 RepID=UPI000B4AEB1B|nr:MULTISPECIES: MerR family transcriptional regulator [Rhodomicrobium]
MIGERELFAMIGRLDADALRDWLETGLVRGASGEAAAEFDEADVARVRLICELRYELAVEEESLPVVMSLVDQIYDLRRSVRAIAAAIGDEPDDVRSRIAASALRRLRG